MGAGNQSPRNRADALASAGNLKGALEQYEVALRSDPDNPELLFLKALMLRKLERLDEAISAYKTALRLAPSHPVLLNNYANALKDAGRFSEALDCFDQALNAAPHEYLLHFNRANLLADNRHFEAAAAGYEAALRLAPERVDGWCGLGRTLLEAGRPEAALDSYARARKLDPQCIEAVAGTGHAWFELGQAQRAIAAFVSALALEPADADALNGLAMAEQRAGDFARAEDLFSRALALDPRFAEARYNRALLRLSMRRFGEAWADYEGRIELAAFREHLRPYPASVEAFLRLPRWNGQPLPRKKVGVWAEQGLGDQVLFSMLLPELARIGQAFVYEVDRRLLPAYRRVFPELSFVALSDPPDTALLESDQAVFCGSLPGLLRPQREPASDQWQPVLRAETARVEHYRTRMGRQPRVALSWRSARAGWVGRDKSAELAMLAPLLQVPGVQWVDIQYGDTADERSRLASTLGVELLHFDAVNYRDDLEEVLAIIESCDLVIATSSAAAHLAGALGKATWLLQAGGPPFHYWVPGANGRCPWYPGVEIKSVPGSGDWSALSRQVAGQLAAWLEQPRG